MLLQIGASSSGMGLLSGVPSVEVLDTVVCVCVTASLGFVAILAQSLLVGATLFFFSAALLTFLTLGLVSG